jgi:hypothetical protein
VLARDFLPATLKPAGGRETRRGPRGHQTEAEDQGMNDRRGARDAVEAGEGEQDQAGQQFRRENGFGDLDGVMNGKVGAMPSRRRKAAKASRENANDMNQ